MNYEPNLGLYDMRRDTEGLPRSLANRINSNICCGGGGGGSKTTTTGIDPAFKPQLVESLDMSNQQLRDQMSGKKKITAGMTPQQLRSLAAQENYAQAKIDRTGPYDMGETNKRDLQKIYGRTQAQMSNSQNLSSARAQAMQANAIADQSSKNAKFDMGLIDQGINDMGLVGSAYQKGEQAQLDSTSRALDDYFKRLTGAAGKESTTTGGGGK